MTTNGKEKITVVDALHSIRKSIKQKPKVESNKKKKSKTTNKQKVEKELRCYEE